MRLQQSLAAPPALMYAGVSAQAWLDTLSAPGKAAPLEQRRVQFLDHLTRQHSGRVKGRQQGLPGLYRPPPLPGPGHGLPEHPAGFGSASLLQPGRNNQKVGKCRTRHMLVHWWTQHQHLCRQTQRAGGVLSTWSALSLSWHTECESLRRNLSKLCCKIWADTKPISSTKCVVESGNTNHGSQTERGIHLGRRSWAKQPRQPSPRLHKGLSPQPSHPRRSQLLKGCP